MFRLAFIAYLSFAALAGPSFCCCTATKVGAWLAGATNAADSHGVVTTCCSGKRAAKASVGTRHDACGLVARSAGKSHDCECPEHDSEAVQASQRLETAKAVDEYGAALVWPPVALLPPQFGAEDGPASRYRPVRASFAYLSAQEILRALQRFLL